METDKIVMTIKIEPASQEETVPEIKCAKTKRIRKPDTRKRQRIAKTYIEFEVPSEILWAVLYHVTLTKKNFLNMMLVCKEFGTIALQTANIRSVQQALMESVIEKGRNDIFQLLISNPHLNPTIANYAPLRYASQIGDIDAVQNLLKITPIVSTGPNINYCESLVTAAKEGHVEVVKVLLAHPSVDPTYMSQVSLLVACKNGRSSVVQQFLLDGRVKANYFALCEASESGDVNIVKMLCDAGAVPWSNLQIPGSRNKAFWKACQHGRSELVDMYIKDYGVDPSFDNNEPIFRAIYKGQHDIVIKLLADPRVSNKMQECHSSGKKELNDRLLQAASESGNLALVQRLIKEPLIDLTWKCVFSAAARGHLDILNYLLSDPRIVVDMLVDGAGYILGGYNEALNRACANGHVEVVKRMLTLNTNPFCNSENPGILRASQEGHLEIVKLLSKDPRCCSRMADEALYAACFKGKVEVAKYLLEETNANPTIETRSKIIKSEYYLPLEVACANGYLEIVELLLRDKRVDPASKCNTCIVAACTKGQDKIVEYLLKDPRVDPTVLGNDAFGRACENGHVEVVKLLLKDPRVDPSDRDNAAFIKACLSVKVEVVKLLLEEPRIDPCARDGLALRHTVLEKKNSIYKLLLKDPRINPKNKKFYVRTLRNECEGIRTLGQIFEWD